MDCASPFVRLLPAILFILFSCGRAEAGAVSGQASGSAGGHASPPVLTIAGSRNLPPFSMLDGKGDPIGIGIDLWRLWSQKTGIPVRFRLTDITRSLEDLQDGRADLHAGLLRSPERSAWLDFSQPYLRTPALLHTRYTDGRQHTLSDFAAARIGVQGPVSLPLLQQFFPQASARSYESIPQMIEAVERGEIDAFIADRPSTDLALLRLGQRGEFTTLDQDLFPIALRAAVPKHHKQLLETIDKGLSEISRSEFEAILARWLDRAALNDIEFPPQARIGLDDHQRQWLQRHKTLRFAVDPNFAPYEFLDDAGHYRGVSADMLKVLSRRLGVTFQRVPVKSWQEALQKARAREIDLLPLANDTPDRETYLTFTTPYLVSQRHIITRRQHHDIQTEADLPGHILALPAGYSITADIRHRWPGVTIVEAPDIPTALQRVSLGAADATILSSGVAGYWLDRREITNLRLAGTTGRPSSLAMASRSDWPELGAILQNGLDSIDKSERQDIRRRWIYLSDNDRDGGGLDLTPEEQAWIAQHPKIRVGVSRENAPISFVDRDGNYRGLAADYLDLLGQRLGIDFSAVTGTGWSATLDRVRGGQLDMIDAISRSEERQQFLTFTLPYYTTPNTIYVRRDDRRIAGMDDLKGLTLAVERDYKVHERLSMEYPSIHLLVVDDSRQALMAVASGEADAYIGDRTIADRLIENDRIDRLKRLAPANELGKSDIRMGVRKDWPMLAGLLNKALAGITAEEHRMLRRRWLDRRTNAGAKTPLALSEAEREWLKAHPRIDIGVMNAWPPMDFSDAQGNPKGIGADIVHLLNDRLGGVLHLHPASWDDIYTAVKEKRLPALMGITPTPERQAYFRFTEPYLTIPHVIIARKDSPYADNIGDLAGRRVAVEKGFMIGETLARTHPEIDLRTYASTSDALDAVAKGEVDAYIGNRAVALYLIEHELISNLRIQGKSDETVSVNAIGVREDWPILRDILQKALSSISREELHGILRKWVPDTEEKPASPDTGLTLTPEERAWLHDHPEIRIGLDPDWEPIEFIDRSGTYRGISATFMAHIKKMLGITLKRTPNLSWSKVIEGARTGAIDLLPAITPSPERARFLNFTKPYLHFPFMVFTRREAPLITDIDDLGDALVAVERGYVTQEYLQHDHPNLRLMLTDTTAQAMQALAAGKVDAYIGNLTLGSYLIDKLGLGNLKVAAPTPYANDLAIGVRKDWPELR
ncbi:MAG: transporter substrate-binding domain-containing protein, partial [Candidatus Thiodiazotropha sp.]